MIERMSPKLPKTWGQLRPRKECAKHAPKRHDTPAQAKRFVEGFVGMLAGMCVNGHIWILQCPVPLNRRGEAEAPEGAPCACGKATAHYKVCRTCGHRELVPTLNGAID